MIERASGIGPVELELFWNCEEMCDVKCEELEL